MVQWSDLLNCPESVKIDESEESWVNVGIKSNGLFVQMRTLPFPHYYELLLVLRQYGISQGFYFRGTQRRHILHALKLVKDEMTKPMSLYTFVKVAGRSNVFFHRQTNIFFIFSLFSNSRQQPYKILN